MTYMVKILHLKSYGRTNNYHVDVFFKHVDQSCPPVMLLGLRRVLSIDQEWINVVHK